MAPLKVCVSKHKANWPTCERAAKQLNGVTLFSQAKEREQIGIQWKFNVINCRAALCAHKVSCLCASASASGPSFVRRNVFNTQAVAVAAEAVCSEEQGLVTYL